MGVPEIAMIVPPEIMQNAPTPINKQMPQSAIAKIIPVVPVKNFVNVSMTTSLSVVVIVWNKSVNCF